MQDSTHLSYTQPHDRNSGIITTIYVEDITGNCNTYNKLETYNVQTRTNTSNNKKMKRDINNDNLNEELDVREETDNSGNAEPPNLQNNEDLLDCHTSIGEGNSDDENENTELIRYFLYSDSKYNYYFSI